jgi:hypothetical protein
VPQDAGFLQHEAADGVFVVLRTHTTNTSAIGELVIHIVLPVSL